VLLNCLLLYNFRLSLSFEKGVPTLYFSKVLDSIPCEELLVIEYVGKVL